MTLNQDKSTENKSKISMKIYMHHIPDGYFEYHLHVFLHHCVVYINLIIISPFLNSLVPTTLPRVLMPNGNFKLANLKI